MGRHSPTQHHLKMEEKLSETREKALLLATSVAVLLCSTAYVTVMNVTVAEDTYVSDQSSINVNYGTSHDLTSMNITSGGAK